MANFLLFECLKPQARKVLVDCMPERWKPPHSDFGGIKQFKAEVFTMDEAEEIRLEKEVKPVMEATPEQVKHWRNT